MILHKLKWLYLHRDDKFGAKTKSWTNILAAISSLCQFSSNGNIFSLQESEKRPCFRSLNQKIFDILIWNSLIYYSALQKLKWVIRVEEILLHINKKNNNIASHTVPIFLSASWRLFKKTLNQKRAFWVLFKYWKVWLFNIWPFNPFMLQFSHSCFVFVFFFPSRHFVW